MTRGAGIWSRVDRNVKILVAVAIVLALLPLWLQGASLEIGIRILLFAMLATAWNLMAGYAGLFSFGHAAYFGLGAYATAVLQVDYGWSPWLGMLVGMVLAGLFAVLTGYLSFRYRLKGAYFVLTTFAFAEMLRLIFLHWEFVNRAIGFRVPLIRDGSWTDMQFPPGSPAYYYVVLGMLLAVLIVVILLMRSRSGYYIVAIRDNEEAAAALGVNPMRYKLYAVGLSGALTAMGGTFYFQYIFFIDPSLAFGPAVSIQILLPAIIGGMGTMWGPLIGAFLLVPLGEVTSGLVRNPPELLSFLSGRAGLDLMIFGALLVAIIMFLPKGVYGSITQAVTVRRQRQQRAPATASAAGTGSGEGA
jgi:branched-chain amino acid transport system permease protein